MRSQPQFHAAIRISSSGSTILKRRSYRPRSEISVHAMHRSHSGTNTVDSIGTNQNARKMHRTSPRVTGADEFPPSLIQLSLRIVTLLLYNKEISSLNCEQVFFSIQLKTCSELSELTL